MTVCCDPSREKNETWIWAMSTCRSIWFRFVVSVRSTFVTSFSYLIIKLCFCNFIMSHHLPPKITYKRYSVNSPNCFHTPLFHIIIFILHHNQFCFVNWTCIFTMCVVCSASISKHFNGSKFLWLLKFTCV